MYGKFERREAVKRCKISRRDLKNDKKGIARDRVYIIAVYSWNVAERWLDESRQMGLPCSLAPWPTLQSRELLFLFTL